PGGSVLVRFDLAVAIHTGHLEGRIGSQPILLKAQAMLDQRRADVRVIAHTVAAHPGIDQGERQNKQEDQAFPVSKEWTPIRKARNQLRPQSKTLLRGPPDTSDTILPPDLLAFYCFLCLRVISGWTAR